MSTHQRPFIIVAVLCLVAVIILPAVDGWSFPERPSSVVPVLGPVRTPTETAHSRNSRLPSTKSVITRQKLIQSLVVSTMGVVVGRSNHARAYSENSNGGDGGNDAAAAAESEVYQRTVGVKSNTIAYQLQLYKTRGSSSSSFQETQKPVKTHLDEVNLISESIKGYQYGITVDPVRIHSLKEVRVLRPSPPSGVRVTLESHLYETPLHNPTLHHTSLVLPKRLLPRS